MRITGCIAAEKVAKVIVPSENMTIPLTDPFLSEEYGLMNCRRLTHRKNRAIKLDIYIRAAEVGDGFKLRERVHEILGFVAGGSHIQG